MRRGTTARRHDREQLDMVCYDPSASCERLLHSHAVVFLPHSPLIMVIATTRTVEAAFIPWPLVTAPAATATTQQATVAVKSHNDEPHEAA